MTEETAAVWRSDEGNGRRRTEEGAQLHKQAMKQEGKHHQKMCVNPHNRADLELTNGMKRTEAMQARACVPAVVCREHGCFGRPRCGRIAGGLRRRRCPPTVAISRRPQTPPQTPRRFHERKRKTKRSRNPTHRQGSPPPPLSS